MGLQGEHSKAPLALTDIGGGASHYILILLLRYVKFKYMHNLCNYIHVHLNKAFAN